MNPKSPKLVGRNLEDYDIKVGNIYTIESLADINVSDFHGGIIDEEKEGIGDYGNHAAKLELTIPKGIKMHMMFDSSKSFVRLSVIGESHVDERQNNDKRYSRIKTLQDSTYNTLFTIRSDNNNPDGEDFGKDIIRKDGSFIVEAGRFWTIFHSLNVVSKVEIKDEEGNIKKHVKDSIVSLVA